MRINNLFASLAVLFFAALAPAVALAGGPKDIQDPATRTPYKYKGPVRVYTDLGNLGIVSNAAANTQVAFSYKQWTDVPTSSFEASVVGDFSVLGIGDVTKANVGQVIGAFNGGGIHVIYDTDGTILRDVFGVPGTVLGVATPEYVQDGTNEIVESWAIMNGRGVPAGDTTGAKFAGVMTHEFGHSIGLAHTQTNGGIIFYGDTKGPYGVTSLPYSGSPTLDDLETMYPFLNPAQTGIAQSTVNCKDDIMAISDLYPMPGWPENYGTITGTIKLTDGVTEVTGVNVIARNIANPWQDAVSALSGDYTQGELGPDGRYTFHGLTPNAQYVVYVDAIVAGGFSTPAAMNLPGPEEFYSGANEGTDPDTDLVGSFETITAGAGVTYTADIAFNTDDGAPQLEFLGDNISPTDITADGSTIVGLINVQDAPTWRWTRTGGFEILGGVGSSSNISISSDGSKIVSTYRDENGLARPGIWQGGTTWSPVPLQEGAVNSSGSLGSGYGVSDNGDITGLSYIGLGKPRAFRYDAATNTTVSLDTPAAFNQSRGNGITADGSTVYGWTARGFRFGAIWRDGVLTPVGTNVRPAGEVSGVSGDGQVFVGGNLALEGTQAYRWTFAGGIEPIGSLPYPDGTGSFTQASAANYDGSVIVGYAGPSNNRRGFIWTRQTGIMNINDFLRTQGTFIQREWYLANPYAITPDGRTIIGWGISATSEFGFRLDIPKVKICHAPPGNPNNAHTIDVAFPDGIEDHLAHGDTLGPCSCESDGNGNGNGGH